MCRRPESLFPVLLLLTLAGLVLAGLVLAGLAPAGSIAALRPACAESEQQAPVSTSLVEEVRLAVRDGDTARLREIAEWQPAEVRSTRADLERSPWRVVHELIVLGHREEAHALLRASTEKRLDPLRRYLRSIERRNPPRELLQQQHQIAALAASKAWYDLSKLSMSSEMADASRSVPGIDIRLIVARARLELDYYDAAIEQYDLAAQGAHALEWWAAERVALDQWMWAAIRFSDAGGLLRSARRILELASAQGDRAAMARARADVGSALGELQQYGAALTEFRIVLNEYDDVLEDSTRIHVLTQMSLAESSRGHFSDAQRFALRALDVVQRASAAQSVPIRRLRNLDAWARETLGVIYTSTGDFDEARAYLDQAMEIAKAQGDLHLQAEILGNQGVVEVWDGNDETAHALMEQALAAYRQQGQRIYAARAEANLAEAERRQAESMAPGEERRALLAGALARLERAESQQREGSDLSGHCTTQCERAVVLLLLGEGQKALARADGALQEARRLSAIDLEVEALTTLARVHNGLGQRRRALALAVDAAQKLSFLFDRLPPDQAALARRQTAPVYEEGLEAAVALDLADEAWFFLEAGRAGALLLALEDRDKIKDASVPHELLQAEQEARLQVAMAYDAYRRVSRTGKLPAQRAARELLEARRKDHKRAVQRIQLEQAEVANLLYPTPEPVDVVRKALAPDEALVLFGRAGDEVVSLVVSKASTRLVRHGPYAQMKDLCLGLRYGLKGPVDAKMLATMRARIAQPLALPAGVKRVLLSPMECLAYQPLGMVFPGHEYAAIPSAMSWLRLQGKARLAQGPVLALGDPDYGPAPATASDARLDRSGNLVRLPETAEESRRVARHEGDEVLLGKEASETNLRARLRPAPDAKDGQPRRLRALHLACHGLVNEQRPSFSGLVLSATPQDDGFLTVVEICRLRIRSDLVVLSACDSGTGRHQSAEGVLGLMRAFQVAGCRQVIASLWKVDDEATRALMIRFHELWNAEDPAQRLGAAAALRAAQEYVRTYAQHHDGKHPEWQYPHYWAAWQLWGPGD